MQLELLAPARDLETGMAAVDSGADAVYMAGPAFGAREAAANSLADIAKVAAYARRYGAKTYLTLNTLLHESEYETARRLAIDAWEAGCSALIIQDPALLRLDLPPIPLFASTQMDNRTVEQVQRLERLGFSRVILARELSLAQIAEIRAQTQVAIESFVHGALCVCYSGRCYISEYLTGRSANRGACAQICRNRFDLETASGKRLVSNKHLLSLKDLQLDTRLQALANAGIRSFKIEGRLKDAAYVKNVVAHYRRVLDALAPSRNSLGQTQTCFEPDPERTFSRGHCQYFIDGTREAWATMDYGKACGQRLGTLEASDGGRDFKLQLDARAKPPQTGDGLCWMDASGHVTGSAVNSVRPQGPASSRAFLLDLQSPPPPFKGSKVCYRNFDRLFSKDLERTDGIKRVITAVLEVEIGAEKVFCTVRVGDISVGLNFGASEGQPAKQPELADARIRAQLEKSAEGMFHFNVDSLQNPLQLFFPVAQVNQWRRSLGVALREAVEHHFAPHPCERKFPTDAQDFAALQQHVARLGEMPQRLMQCKYCLKYELGYCGKALEPLYLRNQNQKFRLEFDCKHCEMSVFADLNPPSSSQSKGR